MALGLFKGERTYRLRDRDGGTEFSMTEECSAGSWCERIVTCLPPLRTIAIVRCLRSMPIDSISAPSASLIRSPFDASSDINS